MFDDSAVGPIDVTSPKGASARRPGRRRETPPHEGGLGRKRRAFRAAAPQRPTGGPVGADRARRVCGGLSGRWRRERRVTGSRSPRPRTQPEALRPFAPPAALSPRRRRRGRRPAAGARAGGAKAGDRTTCLGRLRGKEGVGTQWGDRKDDNAPTRVSPRL